MKRGSESPHPTHVLTSLRSITGHVTLRWSAYDSISCARPQGEAQGKGCSTWLLLSRLISELTWTLCTRGLKPQKKQLYNVLSSGLNLSPLYALPQALRLMQKAMIWVSEYHRVKVYKESGHLRGQLVASLIQCSYFSHVTIRSRDEGWTCSNLTGGREELQPDLSPSDTICILPHACILEGAGGDQGIGARTEG